MPVEANTLVLGHMIHNNPRRDATGGDTVESVKAEMRSNHRAETERMIQEVRA